MQRLAVPVLNETGLVPVLSLIAESTLLARASALRGPLAQRSDVAHIFAHRQLTPELITRINDDADPIDVQARARASGYPA